MERPGVKTAKFLAIGVKFLLRYLQNTLGFYRPYFAQWEITYRCNLKCIFCNVYKDKTYDTSELSTPESLRLLDELKKAGILFINFTGGEPFLKKDFVEILRHAKKLGFFVTMNENGLLLKQHAPLIRNYVDSIHVSLDSHRPQEYEMLRGAENTFSKVLEGIQAAKEQGIHVAVNMTITKKNFDQMEEFCVFAKDLAVDVFLTIVSVIPTEFSDTSQSEDIKVDFKQYAQRVRELKRKYPFIKTSNSYLRFVEQGGFNNYRCLAMTTTINIKPNGAIVLPCGYFPKFKFLGDIHSLKNLSSVQEARKIFQYDFCKDCTLSCFFIPTSLMDIRFWGSLLSSYLFAVANGIKPKKG